MSGLFDKLPSVQELLEAGPLKGLLETAGRNQVVRETTKFLERLKHEAQSLAEQAWRSSPQELAQRAANWINSSAPPPRGAINAGAELIAEGSAPLWPRSVIVAFQAAAEEIHAPKWSAGRAGEAISRLTGFEAGAVFNNAAAARHALAIAYGSQTIAASASAFDAVTQAGGSCTIIPLSDDITSSSETLSEPTSEHPPALVWHEIDPTASKSQVTHVLARAAAWRAPLMIDLGSNGLTNGEEFGLHSLSFPACDLTPRADYLLLRGDRLFGGPESAFILGKKSMIEPLSEIGAKLGLLVAPPQAAAISAHCDLWSDLETAAREIPLIALLKTPLENLRLRAERLAPQMARSSEIANASTIASHVKFTAGACDPIPSWAILLEPRVGSASELQRRLLASSPAILTHVQNDRVVLELRCFPPKYDLDVVASVIKLGGRDQDPVGEQAD